MALRYPGGRVGDGRCVKRDRGGGAQMWTSGNLGGLGIWEAKALGV